MLSQYSCEIAFFLFPFAGNYVIIRKTPTDFRERNHQSSARQKDANSAFQSAFTSGAKAASTMATAV